MEKEKGWNEEKSEKKVSEPEKIFSPSQRDDNWDNQKERTDGKIEKLKLPVQDPIPKDFFSFPNESRRAETKSGKASSS